MKLSFSSLKRLLWMAVIFCLHQLASANQPITDILRDFGSQGKTVADVRWAAKNMAVDGTDLPGRSTKLEQITYSGDYTAPTVTGFLGMAIFSDDGCDITMDGVKIHARANAPQALPSLADSFRVLRVQIPPGQKVSLTVDYTNVRYTGSSDIDGCALFVFYSPFELRDIKDHQNTSDDEIISPWDKNFPIANDNIAWIEAHTSNQNAAPRMPQLEFKVPNLPQGTTIEAKLEVHYDRGNGARGNGPGTGRNKAEDTVQIPAGGGFQQVSGDTWQIWQAYQQFPFFGGDATLTYRLMNGQDEVQSPRAVNFRLGGKNPEPARAKSYIESLADAGPQGSIWFAYAMAKHESADLNGLGTRYNQFYTLPANQNDNYFKTRTKNVGRPVWGSRDGATKPGGYGMFQVTGNVTDPMVDIPREQIWNWQKNAEAGRAILKSKYDVAKTKMDERRQDCLTQTGQAIPVPNHSVPRGSKDPGTMLGDPTDGAVQNAKHTFTDSDITSAVAIKRYNGALPLPPGSQTGTGDYCIWRDNQGHWEFRRWRVIDGKLDKVSYVDLVAGEFE
jgi:hypothetical protein